MTICSFDAPCRCPVVLVAAPASGQGKTTVAAALARLHTRAGQRVRAFKCGPDFIDPHWLSLACGHPVDNLDLWMTGEDEIRARLYSAAQQADLIIVEGVMGLFDGTPSAADLAQRFGLPVLAVIDAGAMAGTFGALAFGLQHYRAGLPWAGVLANRVASARHAQMLQAALPAASAGTPSTWLGAVMRDTAFSLPERHLGLTVAAELPDAMARLDAVADALAATDLGQLAPAAWQRWSVAFEAPPASPPVPQLLADKTIAVARDAAFCFIYPANLTTLEALGAKLVFFSPLADEQLPECDAVWLPGGYPELYTETLAQATACRGSVQAHVQAGKPVWAECGGMMVLFESITQTDGSTAAFWGLLPGCVTMQPRLVALGPQQLTWAECGTLRGHTFHYSRCETTLLPVAQTESVAGGVLGAGEVLYQHGSVRASYFHAWFASAPVAAAALFLP